MCTFYLKKLTECYPIHFLSFSNWSSFQRFTNASIYHMCYKVEGMKKKNYWTSVSEMRWKWGIDGSKNKVVTKITIITEMEQSKQQMSICGNARDSHSGGPWFKSRCRPTWLGFFVVFLNHQGKCWVGFSLLWSIWPLFIKFIYQKINSVNLTIEHWLHTTIEIHSLLIHTQRP